ncbi:hypothetical protein A7U60_g7071 [Sanghuangporus baumii]|uniref:PHD-type domain-containing protein n=1 Tax=Sanghuangporus baumii TaxID=108892 RepID=A0A9Q5N0X6_SANBA|nr:hypothetical protein A7U60_g7071 [Sanghuangporus baumii]
MSDALQCEKRESTDPKHAAVIHVLGVSAFFLTTDSSNVSRMPEAGCVACDVCSLRTTSEFNFLLKCFICSRGFHHRCCRPPIPDEVLTSLIKVTLKNKPGKGIKFWKCYDCRGGKVPPALPGQATSSTSFVIPQKRKQAEIIVISDDDDEPSREIVVSSQPSARRRSAADKTTQPTVQGAVEDQVMDDSITIARRSYPPRQNENVIHARPKTPLEVPPISAAQRPSSYRFGLLSPPTSVGGSTIRFPSSTPFFPDSDSPGPSNIRTKIHAVPPTPPVSARPSSPYGQMPPPPAPKMWKTEGIKQDLKLLSQQFKNTYHANLAVGDYSTPRARQPRKPTVTRLNNRTSGQCFFYHFGTPE